MNKEEFNKLSELERDFLEYAMVDFWNEYNFRERIKSALQDIEFFAFRHANPTNIDRLPFFSEILHSVCINAENTWKHYAQKALEEFNEYEE